MRAVWKVSVIVSILIIGIAGTSVFAVTINEDTKITASDAAGGDFFGQSVSSSGDRIVVGAPRGDGAVADSGSVYVYDFDGDFDDETELTASDADAIDTFGGSVSVSGDRIVVGALSDKDAGSFTGSAYVYDFNGATWDETKLVASDADAGDAFGVSVSVSGDRIVVGASGNDDAGSSSGSAYVYDFDGTDWDDGTKLVAFDADAFYQFGRSVSVFEDRIVVGANGGDGAVAGSGSAYVYDFDGDWDDVTKLIASDGDFLDSFGLSVSVFEDRIVVGASGDDDAGTNTGSAYVYDFNGATWDETKLVASDADAIASFGTSVSVFEDRIIVGTQAGDGTVALSGSAYVYDFDGVSWIETKFTASDGAELDNFGLSVSVSEDRSIAGARLDDDAGSKSVPSKS